jgi:hypothetical protein
MKAEDFIPAGVRAKKNLRVAQALATLSTKGRQPALSTVKEALTKVQGPQPAIAMAIILQHSKRHPLHERGEWLKAADETLQEYRLSDYADQKEAELAQDYIGHELTLYKAEIARIEKMRERFSLAILCLLVTVLLTCLAYFPYKLLKEKEQDDKKPSPALGEKQPDNKHDPMTAPAKTPAAPNKAEPKPAEPDKKTPKPGNK